MSDIKEHFLKIVSHCDWLDPENTCLSSFAGDFEMGRFLEKPSILSDDCNAHNFLMGRNSYYHCRFQAPNNTIIGRHCSVNATAIIGAVNHNYKRLTTGLIDMEKEAMDAPSQDFIFRDIHPTIIGCDVWIAANTVILQGCKIGHGACIGAGSIVTSDIPPYAIVVGAPARVVKYRFNPSIRRRLLASRWWMLPAQLVSKLPVDDIEFALDIAESYWRKK